MATAASTKTNVEPDFRRLLHRIKSYLCAYLPHWKRKAVYVERNQIQRGSYVPVSLDNAKVCIEKRRVTRRGHMVKISRSRIATMKLRITDLVSYQSKFLDQDRPPTDQEISFGFTWSE